MGIILNKLFGGGSPMLESNLDTQGSCTSKCCDTDIISETSSSSSSHTHQSHHVTSRPSLETPTPPHLQARRASLSSDPLSAAPDRHNPRRYLGTHRDGTLLTAVTALKAALERPPVMPTKPDYLVLRMEKARSVPANESQRKGAMDLVADISYNDARGGSKAAT